MSLTNPCPTCGNLRRCVDRTAFAVVWFCGWCRTHAEESLEPDVRAQLQREWERR